MSSSDSGSTLVVRCELVATYREAVNEFCVCIGAAGDPRWAPEAHWAAHRRAIEMNLVARTAYVALVQFDRGEAECLTQS